MRRKQTVASYFLITFNSSIIVCSHVLMDTHAKLRFFMKSHLFKLLCDLCLYVPVIAMFKENRNTLGLQ